MSILKLKPAGKDYLWGGRRLIDEYGKESDGEILAETWELSCHPDGASRIVNGPFAGMTLQEYIDREGKEVLGKNCMRFRDFPILIKFIDARDNLSIQVHPNNRYALKNEGQYGKTEMWYVMDAGENAFLYYGFKEEISREEFARRIQNNTLEEVLNPVPVHKGDVLFIEAGTIHAIGKDILIAEIQQNSNVTYRVYDYGRTGKDGIPRELHIEKALDVTNRKPAAKDDSCYPHMAGCDYFTVDKLNLDGGIMGNMQGKVSEASFASILILDGKGTVENNGETLEFRKGDSLFLPAGSGDFCIRGMCDALVTTIREKKHSIRVGIDIGGTQIKTGLVNEENQILAGNVMQTDTGCQPRELIGRIAENVLALLQENDFTADQCVGVGVGMPGTIDREKGLVLYSNNIPWENVELQSLLEEYLPLPVKIANDADCAAIGEALAGAGRGISDMVLLTLGAGVGGGIILDGQLYKGGGAGSELGHMVIAEDGELCTCGRKGCLEAYVSASGLMREAEKATGKRLTPEQIFDGAKNGDALLKEAVSQFTKRLGTGVTNIANIFRPRLILIGGILGSRETEIIPSLQNILEENCFGRSTGKIPKIKSAALGDQAGMIGAAGLFE